MISLDQHFLSFWIRWIHVISMAFMLGGVMLLFALVIDSHKTERNSFLLVIARKYESFFWLAIGVQVITGIGNIGSFGAGIPSVTSDWGIKLLLKLIFVVLFVLLSLVRTLLATRLESNKNPIAWRTTREVLKSMYSLTAIVLGAIVLMAEALAHG